MTPWLQADIDVVARAPKSDAFEKSPFLALHIRRGDKIRLHEAKLHPCEVRMHVLNVFPLVYVCMQSVTRPHAAPYARLEQVRSAGS